MNYDIFLLLWLLDLARMSLTFTKLGNFTEGEMKMSIKMLTLLQSHKDVNNDLMDSFLVWFDFNSFGNFSVNLKRIDLKSSRCFKNKSSL